MTLRYQGLEKAAKAIEANQSERYRALDRLERYVDTTQYEGRQSWWASGPEAKPLLERAPCIAYPIVAAAIESNVDLLLGEGRYPELEVELPFEDESAELPSDDDGDDLPNEYVTIQQAIGDVCKQSKFKTAAAEAFSAAQGCGTAVTTYGTRNQRLFIDSLKAKWCEPEFELDGSVKRVDIRYPYSKTTRQPDGSYLVEAKLFRRVIDAERDTTYLPADADENGREPSWREDPNQTIEHGLGHCPVVWYQHMQGCSTVDEYDGRAIHENALDEIEAHDFAISQRHRAALISGDPQWTEIGVDDSSPGASGRHPADVVHSTKLGGAPSQQNPIIGAYNMGGAAPARKKGPGEVWKYPDKDVKVQMHTLPAGALDAIHDNAADIRQKIAESLAVVFLDAESLKFAASMSGKAIALLKGRQTDRVDKYRPDFGNNWMVPQLQGLLRVVARFPALKLRGAKQVAAALEKIGGVPDIELKWGPYFPPSPEDEERLVNLTVKAKDSGLATIEMSLQKLKSTLGIVDVDETRAELEAEAEERAKKETDQLLAEHKAMAAFAKSPAQPGKNAPAKSVTNAADPRGA